MRATSRLLADGRVTIPCTIREELELERGDAVEVEVSKITDNENDT